MAGGLIARPADVRRRGTVALRQAAERSRAGFSTEFSRMSELQSRVLVATEAIMICAPLTVLLLVREIPAQIRQLTMTPAPETLGIFVSGLFMLAALLCLWRMVVAFTVHGGAALRRVSAHAWAIAALAAALSLRTAFHFMPAAVTQRSWLNEFAWGLPFIVPLLHLSLERWLRRARRPAMPRRRVSRTTD
jgi:hypothetical protein